MLWNMGICFGDTTLFDNSLSFYKELAMDPEGKNYGRGPRELTGAVDLISHYKLLAHHDFFCKRSLPLSISDTHYLHNVVGDTEIRKGEGMQLDQLIQNTSNSRDTNARIQPFDLDVLREAFQLRETSPVELPPHKSSKIDEMGAIKSLEGFPTYMMSNCLRVASELMFELVVAQFLAKLESESFSHYGKETETIDNLVLPS
ncbi:hypothetical protein EZV62_020911 [Acer yangbiense]|uniref:Uncharacterized protein n=1 Tax=Acer yangbiense TaxID=1000413 RepID=A0A5C7HG52_9ROSI|nr:hypothetical protein EZV62_020911 [Acer yangbiense]